MYPCTKRAYGLHSADACRERQLSANVHYTEYFFADKNIDTLVLGCTHYPFLRDVITKVIGERNVEIIDSGEAVEKRVESLLEEYDLRAEQGHRAEYEFVSFADEDYVQRLRCKAFAE